MTIYWVEYFRGRYIVNKMCEGDEVYTIINSAKRAKEAWPKAEKAAGEDAVYTTMPDWARLLGVSAKACYIVR